jgi:hypothetical protein
MPGVECGIEARMTRHLVIPSLAVGAVLMVCCDSKPKADGMAVAADPTPSAADTPAPVRRSAIECAKYFEILSAPSRSGHSIKTVPGEWGGLREEFRALPPEAQLCGAHFAITPDGVTHDRSGSFVTVHVRSKLDKSELIAFYDALAKKSDCSASPHGKHPMGLTWDCPAGKGSSLTVMVVPQFEMYSIGGLAK